MKEKIERIKEIMIAVATGTRIDEANAEYKKLYSELDQDFSAKGLENPNKCSDLWEFHALWKEKQLGSWASRRAFVSQMYKETKAHPATTKHGVTQYVNPERISELSRINSTSFDLCKLIRLCEELNSAYSNKNFYSCACLLRAIIDHVPPIFEKGRFSEVANNHSGKSFSELMKRLDASSRKIADLYLHQQIRAKEVHPNATQIDFSNELDVLLGEIYRLLK